MYIPTDKRFRIFSSSRYLNPLATPENSTRTFHPFPHLPPELQLMIWSPAQYISSKFDILYFEHLQDFKRGGCCPNNVVARCESVYEMNVCENIALRLRCSRDIGLRFFIWVLVWIWWFPMAAIVTVVVDNVASSLEVELREVTAEIYYAADAAFQVVRMQKDLQFVGWTRPRVEVVTESRFHASPGFPKCPECGQQKLQGTPPSRTTTIADEWFHDFYQSYLGSCGHFKHVPEPIVNERYHESDLAEFEMVGDERAGGSQPILTQLDLTQ
ncbi:hypothetical protein BKA65DRAFT_484512 [Rhexocercosporidium sp. MPI-PUGE-AT-0058]|nr:hypothetical protein BKA65DRAFT_484512 [Rhexocercosporidium sp. MPI-PUGE-AT-0058]